MGFSAEQRRKAAERIDSIVLANWTVGEHVPVEFREEQYRRLAIDLQYQLNAAVELLRGSLKMETCPTDAEIRDFLSAFPEAGSDE